jgi:hypothetical protein
VTYWLAAAAVGVVVAGVAAAACEEAVGHGLVGECELVAAAHVVVFREEAEPVAIEAAG